MSACVFSPNHTCGHDRTGAFVPHHHPKVNFICIIRLCRYLSSTDTESSQTVRQKEVGEISARCLKLQMTTRPWPLQIQRTDFKPQAGTVEMLWLYVSQLVTCVCGTVVAWGHSWMDLLCWLCWHQACNQTLFHLPASVRMGSRWASLIKDTAFQSRLSFFLPSVFFLSHFLLYILPTFTTKRFHFLHNHRAL